MWPVVSKEVSKVREREIYTDNLVIRVHFIIEMSRPALRHGSLNSLFQVALYLPSSKMTFSRTFLSRRGMKVLEKGRSAYECRV